MKFLVSPKLNASNYLKIAQRFAYSFLGAIMLASMVLVLTFMKQSDKKEEQPLLQNKSALVRK